MKITFFIELPLKQIFSPSLKAMSRDSLNDLRLRFAMMNSSLLSHSTRTEVIFPSLQLVGSMQAFKRKFSKLNILPPWVELTLVTLKASLTSVSYRLPGLMTRPQKMFLLMLLLSMLSSTQ